MPEKEFLGDRRRTQEEEYFQRQEQQLIAKLQQQGREATERERLAEQVGVADPEVARDLQTLGYTPETVILLYLVPLLQVAWAEGGVSERERLLIAEAARARGVEAGSVADRQLANWLASRPSADFFEGSLRVIGAILRARTAEDVEASRRDLLSTSLAIASASGGVMGFARVSAEEREVLARLTAELERRAE